MTDKNIFVFLGPSLSRDMARNILPDAHFLPPIRCGNLTQLMRLSPTHVVIIDGYFEKTAAVWHKEILYALSQGVHVLGAASMGALRAAELESFGMHGIGKIFEAYLHHELEDDDEVAVLHHDATHDYQLQTDALVDIRATIAEALNQQIISGAIAHQLITQAKQTFYKQRRLMEVCQAFPRLQQWLRAGNFISQKAEDAKAALKTISTLPTTFSLPKTIHLSAFFKTLKRRVDGESLFFDADLLPLIEKQARYLRLLPKHYLFAKRLARLVSIAHSLDSTLLTTTQTTLEAFATSTQGQFLISAFLILSGDYTTVRAESRANTLSAFKHAHPLFFNVYVYTAYAWHKIEMAIFKAQLRLDEPAFTEICHTFREKHKLTDDPSLLAWQTPFHLSDNEFKRLVQMTYHFDYFVKNNNLDGLNLPVIKDPHFWLGEVLQLTKLNESAHSLMACTTTREHALHALLQQVKQQGEAWLFQLDFYDGLAELNSFIAKATVSSPTSITKI